MFDIDNTPDSEDHRVPEQFNNNSKLKTIIDDHVARSQISTKDITTINPAYITEHRNHIPVVDINMTGVAVAIGNHGTSLIVNTSGSSVTINRYEGPRIVAAANRFTNGLIVVGVRHCDVIMGRQMIAANIDPDGTEEQGFIDNKGVFHTREQAWVIASSAGQITRRVPGDDGKLFSENIY